MYNIKEEYQVLANEKEKYLIEQIRKSNGWNIAYYNDKLYYLELSHCNVYSYANKNEFGEISINDLDNLIIRSGSNIDIELRGKNEEDAFNILDYANNIINTLHGLYFKFNNKIFGYFCPVFVYDKDKNHYTFHMFVVVTEPKFNFTMYFNDSYIKDENEYHLFCEVFLILDKDTKMPLYQYTYKIDCHSLLNRKIVDIEKYSFSDLIIYGEYDKKELDRYINIPSYDEITKSIKNHNDRCDSIRYGLHLMNELSKKYGDEYKNKQKDENVEIETADYKNSISWNEFFMNVAILASKRSKDPVTKVGACIVSTNNRIVSVGYNGMPNGCNDADFPWSKDKDNIKRDKRSYVVHAELNAILNTKADLSNCRIYVTTFPCKECFKAIIQSGIKIVLYKERSGHIDEDFCVNKMAKSAKIELHRYDFVDNKNQCYIQSSIS